MISNRCARKSLVTNCNSIISKNYLRLLVDSNDTFTQAIFSILYSPVRFGGSTIRKPNHLVPRLLIMIFVGRTIRISITVAILIVAVFSTNIACRIQNDSQLVVLILIVHFINATDNSPIH